jgi:NAD-dependent dihydropyrimidine dehydrogenase PreA subunit
VKPGDLPGWLWDTAFRWLPHRTAPGLLRIGHPGPQSPVLVTGNYTLTVRRLTRALEGYDVWLLVADSKGINVWCAAGGGHLTHHDVIAAVRVSQIGALVKRRTLLLPQLAATGVERRKIAEATGWRVKWGSARLEDIPEYLESGAGGIKTSHRFMRFPLGERLEMGLVWSIPMAVIGGALLGLVFDVRLAGISAAVVLIMVLGLFAALPRLPVKGAPGWITRWGFAVAGTVLGAGTLALFGLATSTFLIVLGAACTVAMLVLSLDLAGSTPWYPSSINSFRNRFHVELIAGRCAGRADCVQVCPRAVLKMNGRERKVEIVRPDNCIRCGACIVQCPQDALRFRFADGSIVEPTTVRQTRLNLLGRRAAF